MNQKNLIIAALAVLALTGWGLALKPGFARVTAGARGLMAARPGVQPKRRGAPLPAALHAFARPCAVDVWSAVAE